MTSALSIESWKPPRNTKSPLGGIFDYVSPSRLNLWLKCPLAFRLKYVDGVRLPTPPALFLGQQVHEAIAWFYRHRQMGIEADADDVCRMLTETWSRSAVEVAIRFECAEQEATLRSKAGDLVRSYLKTVAAESARPRAVETALSAPLADPRNGEDLGIPLVGVLDLVLEETAGPVIVDFKTAARAEELMELTHEIQLGCYAHLFRQGTGTLETALEIRRLVKTKIPQISFHRWPARTTQQLGRLFAVIRAYLDDLHAGRFVFRPNPSCSYCDFRERHCCQWSG